MDKVQWDAVLDVNLGGVLGQSPWALMNQLTERNLQFWNDLQKNVAGGEPPSSPKDKAGARRR
jgi:hypothetical protein